MATPPIGLPAERLPTPALLLHRGKMEANVRRMATAMAGVAAIRPHAKTHKCVEIARRQLEAGAVGITAATTREAAALVAGGVPEVLVANEVASEQGIAELVACAAAARILVAVDDAGNAAAISRAALAAGTEIGVLVDVDVGMGRGGTRTGEEAVAVAAAVERLPGLRLRGAMGYEGHTVLERDEGRRERLAVQALDLLAERVARLREAGHAIEIVSAGGTNTHRFTGPHPAVTELQVGTYAVMDTAYQPFAPGFEPALGVLGSVVSAHGDRVILDCGSKTIADISLAPPGAPAGMTVRELHEEHALLDLDPGFGPPPALGERIELTVSYAGGTVNLHDSYHVIDDGRVAGVWKIVARGPGLGPYEEEI